MTRYHMELVEGRSGQSVAQHRAEQQGHLGFDWRIHLNCIRWRRNEHTYPQFYVPDEPFRVEMVMRVCKCIHEWDGCEYWNGLTDLLFLLFLFLLVGRMCFGYTRLP